MIDIPCITLILSKIGKSLLNFPLSIFVIRLDSLCDSLVNKAAKLAMEKDNKLRICHIDLFNMLLVEVGVFCKIKK
jgi:hypothetical protein